MQRLRPFVLPGFFLGFLGFSGVSPGFLWGSLAPRKEYSSLSLKNATFVFNSENGMSQKIPIAPYPRRLALKKQYLTPQKYFPNF